MALHYWQANGEGRAFTLPVVEADDLPTMFAYDPVTDTQSETGSLAHFFCREKWIEDPFGMSDTCPVVAEPDFDQARFMLGGDHDSSAPLCLLDGIAGIVEDV